MSVFNSLQAKQITCFCDEMQYRSDVISIKWKRSGIADVLQRDTY